LTAIVWFRRDLRVHEHPALQAALDANEHVVPAFCLDDRLLHGRHASGPRTQFLLESLTDLDASLRALGSALVVRHGPPESELCRLAAETGAKEIHFTADVSPFARRRGARVASAFRAAGVTLHGHPGLNAIDDIASPRTQTGRPYTVFSPFHRSWERQARREVLGPPASLPGLPAGVRRGHLGVVPGPPSGPRHRPRPRPRAHARHRGRRSVLVAPRADWECHAVGGVEEKAVDPEEYACPM